MLPDSAGGRAVAAFLVVVVTAALIASAGGRIPLWSGLVGIVAMVAAYERAYTDAPSAFLTESPSAFTTVLVGAGLGFLVATAADVLLHGANRGTHDEGSRDDSDAPELVTTNAAGQA